MRVLSRSWLACLLGGLVCVSLLVVVLAGCGGGVGTSGDDSVAAGLWQSSTSPFAPLFSATTGVQTGGVLAQPRPTTVAQRAASRTRFGHLDAVAAARVARQAFPDAIMHPAGALRLPGGARVARYVANNAAQIALPKGKRAIVESVGPMAVETGSGRRVPIDLALGERDGVFEPARPVVGAVIPSHLSQGVQLTESGISVTPVDANGKPLGGARGAIDGASVLYANTQQDSDTVVKPTVGGFSADAILRSASSPDCLYFRLGVPAGATVKQGHPGAGPVDVVENGRKLASVLPPVAHDTAGEAVPVSMTLNGSTLAVSVSTSGEHLWPIAVDPEVIDTNVAEHEGEKLKSNWVNEYSNASLFYQEPTTGESIVKMSNASMASSEWMASTYATQGESRIFNAEAWVYEEVTHGRSRFQILKSGGEESGSVLDELGSAAWRSVSLCAKLGESPCKSTSGSAGNVLRYKQEEIEPESNLFALYSVFGYAKVYITQEKGPELSFNNTSPQIDGGRTNVMYGSGGWLSPDSGAVEMIANDKGVGVSRAGAQELSGGSYHTQIPLYNEKWCKGVQCPEIYKNEITYSPSMSDGEDRFELWGEDMMGYFGYLGFYGNEVMIKVDGAPPHSIKVSGWGESQEISAASHSLTFEATDGEGTTSSSGMAGISVSVDGGAYSAVPVAPCTVSSGPCTASGKWTLNAEGLSEGVHSLIVTATDNAGNEESEELTFDVRHGSPVPTGPGSVDPTTGQFKMTANDVSLAGAGALSRTYESNNLAAGAEGPFGPQWQASLGDGQGITVLPSGSVVLKSSTGATTTFWLNEKEEYESPPGDGNLKIEAKEKEAGKGITEYRLVETKTGATTSFTQPAGMASTMPVYAGQFGQEAGHLDTPGGIAADSSGNLWVADYGNSRIVKFSPQGAVLGVYGSPGPYSGNFNHPRELAINKTTGNVYVTDEGNNRIVELNSSGQFVSTFGWGVSNGKNEYQVCTTYCQAGIAGSGNGQFYEAKGVAIDSSGNVWIGDFGNNRIQEFSATGSYTTKFGTVGTEAGQMHGPLGIAFSGGNLWVAENLNNRVQEFSTSGTYLGGHFGKEGTGNGEFKAPTSILVDPKTGNFYIADKANNRIQEFTSSGTYVTQFGATGSGAGQFQEPRSVAITADGNIYVADWLNNRISEWMHPTWLPTVSENAMKSPTATYSYEAVEVEGKTVIQPTEELAPVPAHVTCGTKPSELKRGCRALTFVYDTGATGATGVNPGQWGTYKGHLEAVRFHAWEPGKPGEEGKMVEPTVAEYEYDNQGRLRAEWDPRISPELKTTYGYDEEGHVVSVTPPGQEPWFLHYGRLSGDVNKGRLLSVVRPPASTTTVLKEQHSMAAPKNTVAPTLSTSSPEVGVTLSVTSHGEWSNSALAYNYQWARCQSGLLECTAIPGAVNQSYTPQVADVGYVLTAQAIASNGAGVGVAGTSATSAVPVSTPSYSTSFGNTGTEAEKLKAPDGTTIDAEGHIWVADYGDNRVEKFSSTGSFMASYAPDSMLEPVGIAFNPVNGEIYVTNRGHNRIDVLSTSGTLLKTFGIEGTGPGQLSAPDQIAIDANGNVWMVEVNNHRVDEFTSRGTYVTSFGSEGSGHGQFMGATGIAFCAGNLYVVDQSTNRVQEFSLEGKWVRQFGEGGTELSKPSEIACEPAGNDLYVTDKGNNRIEEFNAAGAVLKTFAGTGSEKLTTPVGVAVGASGTVYIADNGNNRMEKWTATYSTSNPLPNPPGATTNSVTTYDYHIPVSGTGLPTMSKSEVANWAQKDDPEEAMAVFPPDKPMGWPAKEYERDTLNYMDEQGHTVNIVTPTGGISTTEYNELNEVTRTLSANNRAIAIKESKPAEAAEKLDTQNRYVGGELVETLGPEHKIKLAIGKEGKHNEEVSAREQTKYYYDEGAPEGKEYGLVTRTVDDALVGTKEEEPRTTRTYYSGQNNLGWELRKPTSVVTDPAGLDLVDTTVYDKTTGAVVETKSPGGTAETVYPMSFSTDFGSEGSGSGQLDHPERVALDAAGNVWVDDKDNGRIEKFSATGTFIAAYGSKGSGSLQFSEAWGMAINQTTGNVYVSDTGNNRIEELNSKGEFVRNIGTLGSGNGQLDGPCGLTIDAKGNIWVTDEVNSRVEEFSETGEYKSKFGTTGSATGQFKEPVDVAISEGQLYVADAGNDRIQEFSTTGTYLAQIGSEGTGPGQFKYPYAIVANQTSGNLYITEGGDSRVQEFSPAGKFLTQWETWSKSHELSGPVGIAINNTGELYITDEYADKVSAWLLPEAGGAQLTYASQFGTKGSGESQFQAPYNVSIDGSGNLWVTDNDNNRLDKYSPTGKILANYGTVGTGNGQFKGPTGIAINQSTGNVYVCDGENNRMEELSSSGTFIRTFGTSGSGQLEDPTGATIDASGNVWVSDYAHNRIVKFSATGEYLAAYGSAGTGNGQFKGPGDLVYSASNLYVTDVGNDRIQELSTAGTYIRGFGLEGSDSGEFYGAFGIAADSAGNLYAVDKGNGRVEEFSPTGGFLASFASHGTGEGQLNEPTGVTVSAAGDMYVVDTANNRIQHWEPTDRAVHDTKTTYYTAEGESAIETCRNHPEWANLPCQTGPGGQPDLPGSPELPVDDVTYNLLDEALVTTEKFGTGGSAVTRTKTETYDNAGRALTSEETSTVGASVPKTTNKYNKETGALEEQEATTGGVTKTIKSVYNTLGQLGTYTDADANATTYTYEIDGRIQEVSDPKGKQNYAYDPKTGLMTKLLDSVGTFEATYDVEGRILTETYPDKLVAKYTYNPLGAATGIEYEKKAHCEKTCPEIWFSDTTASSIHGEMLTQASTLSNESYSYDTAGRLTETQEIASKACKTRQYAYDEEGNRLSQTSRESSTETCPTEGGTIERHIYDSANHLMDSGITYDKYGNATELPATDAGGHTLTSTFYVDSQVATQTQNGQTIEYAYDPSGRTRETITKGTTNTTTITHYAGPGEAISWLDEGSSKWTRNVPGPDGALDAIQSSTGTTLLQLHDLQGNIVGQAGTSETETKLQASFNNTEFGVPTSGKTPAKYAWLGATGVKTEFETGVTTEDGASYVPQIGRQIQTASVVPPGAFPNGSGPGSPEETVIPGWITAINENESAAALAEWAAIQQAELASGGGMGTSEIDPGECLAVGSVGEIFEWKTHRTVPYANFKCKGKASNVKVQICVADEGAIPSNDPTRNKKGMWEECSAPTKWAKLPHYEWAIVLPTFQCTVGDWYALYVWYWEPGMTKGDSGWGKEEQCASDGEENYWKGVQDGLENIIKVGGDL